jgi:hypothetical protein
MQAVLASLTALAIVAGAGATGVCHEQGDCPAKAFPLTTPNDTALAARLR